MIHVPQEAIEKYEEFHRHKPKRVGEFGKGFRIPAEVFPVGDSKWVTYRSDKVDPETLRKPRKPINYIHEHNAGVRTYYPSDALNGYDGKYGATQNVPSKFYEVEALVRLGACLGYCFVASDGVKHEAEGIPPLPDLYCSVDGKCLLVIQKDRGVHSVIAMVWGGALGVFARGIDG